jgi:V8-like Glu-specific endopeptidase
MTINLLVSSDPMPNELQEEIYKKKIKECVGKLEINNSIKATCFFLKLPIFKNNHTMKVLLTNNHVISIDYLKDKNAIPLKVEINGKQKIIDFCGDSISSHGKKRFYYTNEKYDFTIIEIKEYDFIDKFLEVDEGVFSETYEKKYIYILQYPQKNQYDSSKYKEYVSSEYKGKLSNNWGKIIKNDGENIIHNCKTYEGSSGSPIILVENHKVIGLHKEEAEILNKNDKNNDKGIDKYKNNVNNSVKRGTSLKNIIEITKKNNKNIVEEKEYKEYFYIIWKEIF